MTVEIVEVVRANGKVQNVTALIGNFEVSYIRLPETGEPYEKIRIKHGSQVLDREGLHIPNKDYQYLQKRIKKIFNEDRSGSKKSSQEGIQGELIPRA